MSAPTQELIEQLTLIDMQADEILRQGNGSIAINQWLRTQLAEARVSLADGRSQVAESKAIMNRQQALLQEQLETIDEVCSFMDTIEKTLDGEELTEAEVNFPLVGQILSLVQAYDLLYDEYAVARRLSNMLFEENHANLEDLARSEVRREGLEAIVNDDEEEAA